MTEAATHLVAKPETNALVEQLRRARQWAWGVFDHRVPGAARDLAWALIALARDHDPETYSPWLRVDALESAQLRKELHQHVHYHRGEGENERQPHGPPAESNDGRAALPSPQPGGDAVPLPSRKGKGTMPDARRR